MAKPTPPFSNPNLPVIYGYEADTGDTVVFSLKQIRQLTDSKSKPDLVNIPEHDGAFDVDASRPTPAGAGDFDLSFMVVGSIPEALAGSIAAIEKITALPGKLWRIVPGAGTPCQWTRARRLGRPRKITDIQTLGLTPWQNLAMKFIAPAAFWFSEIEGEGSYYGGDYYGAGYYGGSAISFAVSGTSTTGTIINPGNAIAKALSFKLIASAAGTITAPRIQQITAAQDISMSGTIQDDYYELKTDVPSLYRGTIEAWDELTINEAHTYGLIWLYPGENEITITSGTAMGGSAIFTFYSPYQ
jgi:hypothetical protein